MASAFGTKEWLWYALALGETGLLWALWLYASARRKSAASLVLGLLFVALFTFCLGEQRYFFDQYGSYIGLETSRFAPNFRESIVNQVGADLEHYLASKLLPLSLGVGLWVACRALISPSQARLWSARLALPLAGAIALFAPFHQQAAQASTPDVLFWGAGGELLLVTAGIHSSSAAGPQAARHALPVPALHPQPQSPRNVVFLLLESVRADATCQDPKAPCQVTPYSNRLTPNRIPLFQMRALSTSTLISLAVLWTGIGPHEPEEQLSTHPLIFDVAQAAGWETAYFTSQNTRFGTLARWVDSISSKHRASAMDLDPAANIDLGARENLLADRVCAELPQLKEPFLAVVHLSGTHFPYRVEEDEPQPFQPATRSKAPDQNPAFFNEYKNSIHQQDRHLARIISCLRRPPSGARTVLVLTSDHGEAFREHYQLGHSISVLDEELHVPGWVDAPPGVLTSSQAQNLISKSRGPTFHVDITATLLDLMGVWNSPGIGQFKQRMLGQSLLEAELNTRALPLSNCAVVWGCAFENWGMMRGFRKLEARAWDPDWHCYDLRQDPSEQMDLGRRACGDLPELALRTFGRRPGAPPPAPAAKKQN